MASFHGRLIEIRTFLTLVYNGFAKLLLFYGFETLNKNTMIKKEQILEILEDSTEWLRDNDVILKSEHSNIADRIVKLCNLAIVTTRFSPTEIENVMRKVKKAEISPYLKRVLQMETGDSYESADDKAFLDKYTGKVANVYEWAGDWWIAEDDNYVITEDCFTIL